MIQLIQRKWAVFKALREAKKSRARYEARAYNYTRIASKEEILRTDMNDIRRTYRKERQKSISANVFFDDNNDAYIIVNKIRYNLADPIDTYGTILARFILNDGDLVIKPLREYIRSEEECVVIALAKTPLSPTKRVNHSLNYGSGFDCNAAHMGRDFI